MTSKDDTHVPDDDPHEDDMQGDDGVGDSSVHDFVPEATIDHTELLDSYPDEIEPADVDASDNATGADDTAESFSAETMQWDPSDSPFPDEVSTNDISEPQTRVFAGTGSIGSIPSQSVESETNDLNKTIDGNHGDGTVNGFTGSDTEENTVLLARDSEESDETTGAIDRTDITQTVNPNDLSDEDREYWGTLLVSLEEQRKPGQSTQQQPAIERSINETKLQIRQRDLASPLDRKRKKSDSDYRLIRLLGKGGMGSVFVARQTSLDRMIAVKVIRPMEEQKRKKLKKKGRLEEVEKDRRHQFLSEAVVTGDLDHPNIVPIHDIAMTSDGTLFYAMKRVMGTPWSKVIANKSREENIDILLKVADAIGFAHTRAVVHRDIKPENIMLGDFGVVLVMDWVWRWQNPTLKRSTRSRTAPVSAERQPSWPPKWQRDPSRESAPPAISTCWALRFT